MKNSSWRRFLRGASLRGDFEEIKRIFLRYVKDETIQPLKDLGRFVAFGVLGSVFVALGSILLLLGGLRFLQEFRILDGSLSWLPYLIIAVVCVAIFSLTAWRIVSGTAQRRLKRSK